MVWTQMIPMTKSSTIQTSMSNSTPGARNWKTSDGSGYWTPNSSSIQACGRRNSRQRQIIEALSCERWPVSFMTGKRPAGREKVIIFMAKTAHHKNPTTEQHFVVKIWECPIGREEGGMKGSS